MQTDTRDSELLWSLSFGTTGGLITFLFSGNYYCGGLGIEPASRSISTACFCSSNGVLHLSLAGFFAKNTGGHFSILDNIKGEYQRSGNFLSIMFILYSFCFITLFTNRSLLWRSLQQLPMLLLYAIVSCSVVLLCQLIGSNSATGMTLGVSLITALIMSRASIEQQSFRRKGSGN